MCLSFCDYGWSFSHKSGYEQWWSELNTTMVVSRENTLKRVWVGPYAAAYISNRRPRRVNIDNPISNTTQKHVNTIWLWISNDDTYKLLFRGNICIYILLRMKRTQWLLFTDSSIYRCKYRYSYVLRIGSDKFYVCYLKRIFLWHI